MQLLRRGYQPRSTHARSAYQRHLHVTSGHAWLGTDVYSCGRKSGKFLALDCKAHAWRGAWDEWWAVARPPASEPPITIWKALSGVWKLTRGQEFWLVAGLAALVSMLAWLRTCTRVSQHFCRCLQRHPLQRCDPYARLLGPLFSGSGRTHQGARACRCWLLQESWRCPTLSRGSWTLW